MGKRLQLLKEIRAAYPVARFSGNSGTGLRGLCRSQGSRRQINSTSTSDVRSMRARCGNRAAFDAMASAGLQAVTPVQEGFSIRKASLFQLACSVPIDGGLFDGTFEYGALLYEAVDQVEDVSVDRVYATKI